VAAPPGYYYLFLNRADDKGRGVIPSVARIVRIGDSSDASEAIQPMPAAAAAPAGGSANPDTDTSKDNSVADAVEQAAAGVASTTDPAAATVGLSAVPTASQRPAGTTLPVLPASAVAVATASAFGARRRLLVVGKGS
jgi:hypothetical protein